MARPANANPDETRARLIGASIDLFARQGFHGTSTREIAARAKVNAATISYYFQDKQGLYEATVDEVYRRIVGSVRAAVESAPLSDLHAIAERVYHAARAERDGVRLLLREILDEGRLSARTEAKHLLPGLESTAKLAADLIGCPPAQARAAAVALSFLVSRYVIQDPASIKSALGARTVEEAHRRVVDTLAATARALLAPAPKS